MSLIFLHSLSFATTPLLAFGPFKIFVLSHALQNGWRSALPLALTPLVADISVILLVWLGLAFINSGWELQGSWAREARYYG